jgi:hypothetical protein
MVSAMVSEMKDVSKASERQRDFLWNQASDFFNRLDNRQPPSVVIPQCLQRTPAGNADTTDKEEPSPSKKRRMAKKARKADVTNKVTNK